MILFYNKKTGKIDGSIHGRFHSLIHLKMWVGDRLKTARIVVIWKPVRFRDEKGVILKDGEGKDIKTPEAMKKMLKLKGEVEGNKKHFYNADFEPNHPQGEIFTKLDKNPKEIKNYRVDTVTKKLVKI